MKHKIRYILSGFLMLPAMLLLVGCADDPFQGNHPLPPAPDGKVRVGLYVDTDNYQRPTSRAAIDENSVVGETDRMPWVFVFDGVGQTAVFGEVKQAIPQGSPPVPYVLLTWKSNPVEILLLANAPERVCYDGREFDFTEASLTASLTGKTLAEVLSLFHMADIASPASVPYSGGYLPMVGGLSLANGLNASSTIGSQSSKQPLTRIVAKVTVTESANDFSIDAWSIVGAKKSSPVFGETVAAGNLMNFSADILLPGTGNPFYLYASAQGETSIIIKGVYKGVENQYYKLPLKDVLTGNVLPVERNKWYRFEVSSVTGGGYGSFAAATTAPPMGDVITASVRVVDLNAHDVTDNGTYYLGLSNSQLLLYGLPQGDELPYTVATVSTTATVAMASGINSVSLNGVIPAGSLALSTGSLMLSSGTAIVATDIILSAIDASFTSGRVVVKLGDLIKVIDIHKVSGILTYRESLTKMDFEGADIYTMAQVRTPSESVWLSLSSDGANNVGDNYIQPDISALTPVYFRILQNAAQFGVAGRSAEMMLARVGAGRTKAYIGQRAVNVQLDPEPVVHGNYVIDQELDDSHFIMVKIKSDGELYGDTYDVASTNKNGISFSAAGTFGNYDAVNAGLYEYHIALQGEGTVTSYGGGETDFPILIPIISNTVVADTCLIIIQAGLADDVRSGYWHR